MSLVAASLAAQGPSDPRGATPVRREFGLRLRLADGVTLVADVFRPDLPGKVPVILVRTPYIRSGANHFYEGQYWASHGYAYVVQDVRGRGDSDGRFEPLVHEARDGYATQTWVARQPWSNGRVGTWGGSYLGWTQVFPAPLNNPALHAMVPMVTPSDPGGFWPMRRGGISLGMIEWAILTEGRANRGLPQTDPTVDSAYRTLPLLTIDERLGHRSDVWRRYLANLGNAAFWRPRSYQPDLPRAKAPMLHLTGWYDGTLGGSLENFATMRARATPGARDGQYLVVGPWRHWVDADAKGDRIGSVVFGPEATVNTYRMYRSWFDRWLKGGANEIAQWPRVRLFAMGINRWVGGDAWPLTGTKFVDYFVDAGVAGRPGLGRLSTTPSAGGSDTYSYDPADPTPFLWSVNLDSGGPDDYRTVEGRRDVLVYTTEPFPTPVTICGPVRALVVASSSARDTDWVARLSLVKSDGYSQRLTEGWVRARVRHGEFRNDPLVPDQPETYQLDLWGTCVGAAAGERIRLAIMSGAFPLLTRNLNTSGDLSVETTPVVARQTIYHDASRRSFVTLPIIDQPNWVSKP